MKKSLSLKYIQRRLERTVATLTLRTAVKAGTFCRDWATVRYQAPTCPRDDVPVVRYGAPVPEDC